MDVVDEEEEGDVLLPEAYDAIPRCSASEVITDISELAWYWTKLKDAPLFALTITGEPVYEFRKVELIAEPDLPMFIGIFLNRHEEDGYYELRLEYDVRQDRGEDYVGDTKGTFHQSRRDVHLRNRGPALQQLIGWDANIVSEAYTCINRAAASNPACIEYLEQLLERHPERPRPAALAKGRPTPKWSVKRAGSNKNQVERAVKYKDLYKLMRTRVIPETRKRRNQNNRDDVEMKEDDNVHLMEEYDNDE